MMDDSFDDTIDGASDCGNQSLSGSSSSNRHGHMALMRRPVVVKSEFICNLQNDGAKHYAQLSLIRLHCMVESIIDKFDTND